MIDLDMSPYAAFVWGAYAVSALVLAGLTGWVVAAARRARRELERRERGE